MKKTIIILLLLMFAIVCAAGCGNKNGPAPVTQDPTNQDPTAIPENIAWSNGDAAAAYIGILTGNAYYIKYRNEEEFEGQKMEVFTETALTGNDVAAITTMGELSSAVIVKDGTLYMVDHANKSVLVSTSGLAINENTFPQGGYVFKESGSAEFFGVSQKYEEYSTDGVDVRFFFDDKDLIGFERIAAEQSMQMEILEISSTIPPSIFEIPDNYELIDF